MEWNSHRYFRPLRPLKSKLSSLRGFARNFTNKYNTSKSDDSNDDEVQSEDNSLIMNENSIVIEDDKLINKSKVTYKKKRIGLSVLDRDYVEEGDDDDDNDHSYQELSVIGIDLWELEKKSTEDLDHWTHLDNVFTSFKLMMEQSYESKHSELKLSELCAIEIGINIGLNDLDSNLIENDILQEKENSIIKRYLTNEHYMTLYQKWILVGYSIGLLFNNLDILEDVIEFIIRWSKSIGIEKLLMGLYLETYNPYKFWNDFDYLKSLSEELSFEFEEFLIKKVIHLKLSSLSLSNLKIVDNLINDYKEMHYQQCLNIIYQIIANTCEKMKKQVLNIRLLDTLQSLSIEQMIIINQLSEFIKISNSNTQLNNKFLDQIYSCLKFQFRSIIPILKIMKSFLNNKRQMNKITNIEHLKILKIIFKPSYKQSLKFKCLFLTESDNTLGLLSSYQKPKRYPSKRFKISPGDLII